MAKDRMLYMKLCFVVIVFGLSFIICNKHYIKYSACYKLPIPKTPFYPDAYKFGSSDKVRGIPTQISTIHDRKRTVSNKRVESKTIEIKVK